MVVARKEPVPPKKTETTRSKSATEIVFEISAMDWSAIEVVKKALLQKAEQMIQTVPVPYEELQVLSKQSEDELKSLHCADVTIEIGRPALGCTHFILLLKCIKRSKLCIKCYFVHRL